MGENNTDIVVDEETKIIKGVLTSKLKNMGKKYFQINFEVKEPNSYAYSQLSKFFQIDNNHFQHEIFIDYNNAPIYWAFESRLVRYLQKRLKPLYVKVDKVEDQKSITDLYSRWVLSDSRDDKKFIASLIIRIIERNDSLNILNQFIGSVLYAYEKSIFNPEKSLKMLDKSKQSLGKIKFEKEIENELHYLIPIFESFFYLKLGNNNEASKKLSEARAINSTGINSKFYTLITDCRTIGKEELRRSLYEILAYDLERVEFGIKANNYILFRFFLENSLFKRLFYFNELAPFTHEIEGLLEEQCLDSGKKMDKLLEKSDKLRKLDFSIFEDQTIQKTVEFINKVTSVEDGRNHVLFMGSLRSLKLKFNSLLGLITEEIRKKHEVTVHEGLEVFQYNIDKVKEKFGILKNDLDVKLDKIQNQIEITLKEEEERFDQTIHFYESKIENLDFGRNYDPGNSFKNVFTYSLVFSALVFLIAGFASYTNGTNFSDSKPGVVDFIIPGLEWGFVAFVLGILLAGGSAASTWYERAMYKSKMNKKYNSVKKQKVKKLESIIQSKKNDEENLRLNYKEQINHYTKSLEKLQNDMKDVQEELLEESQENIEDEIQYYKDLVIED